LRNWAERKGQKPSLPNILFNAQNKQQQQTSKLYKSFTNRNYKPLKMTSSAIRNADVEKLRLKRLLNDIENVEGSGTSMLSIIIPAGGSISKMATKLNSEYGAADNIKSRL
jgi:peptide subunit release factor 1 (eRF1)